MTWLRGSVKLPTGATDIDLRSANTFLRDALGAHAEPEEWQWSVSKKGEVTIAAGRDLNTTRYPTWLVANATAELACSECAWRYDPVLVAKKEFEKHTCTKPRNKAPKGQRLSA